MLDFATPGPGSWQLDTTHILKPMTHYASEMISDPFWEGFAATCRRYGMLLAGLRQTTVNGFMYGKLEPAPEAEFPERVATAAEAFATKRWRSDLDRWDNEVKPATLRRHAELVAVNLDALDTDALITYLEECAANHAAMVTQHHWFNGACMAPFGDFLVLALEATGLPPSTLVKLFAGASPESSCSSPELLAVVAALREDAAMAALVQGEGDAAKMLDELRSAPAPVGPAIEQWVAVVGHRISEGFDVAHPTLLERPAMLIATVRAALAGRAPVDVTSALADVRAQVPEDQRAEFDERYQEALLTYRLRDERGLFSDITAAGVMRRAMLGVGRRLGDAGCIDDAELAVDATVGELTALLRGEAGPTSDELRARAAFRHAHSLDDAPRLLGDPPEPPPPLELLPPPAARVMRAMLTFLGQMFTPSEAPHDDRLVRGTPVSHGVHEGPARIVHSVDDLDRFDAGDVLVTVATSESMNCALAIAGAVVTDNGGPLSHAAIMAREFGIPGITGTRDATKLIPEGALVRVDGATGEVSWS